MKNKNVFKINLIYFVALVLVATIFLLGYIGILRNDILTSFLIQIVVMFAIPLLLYSILNKKKPKETLAELSASWLSPGGDGLQVFFRFVQESFPANLLRG